MMKGVLIGVFFLVFLSYSVTAGLGVSPALKEYQFQPGQKIIVSYSVSEDDSSKKIDLSVGGDLAEYVSLDKYSMKGSGNFKATINLPSSLSVPGYHYISIGAKEQPPENEFLGTSIEIGVLIKIYVPYPGRYAEVNLNIADGNVNEQIPVETYVINRGQEQLEVNPEIFFYSESGEKVDSMGFSSVSLNSGEERYFRKFLDTEGYRPGVYLAQAIVSYGSDSTVLNQTFKVGSLKVDIVNFTEKLSKPGIQKYIINVENGWNGEIKELYADVNLSNSSDSLSFRTPSVELVSWGKNTLTGFVDTDSLSGEYDSNIVLSYSGEKSSTSGKLLIVEPVSFSLIVVSSIVVGLIVLIAVAWVVFRRKRKRRK